MKRIKIGQIGVCHEHASGKMKTLRLLSDVFEIVGVVDDRASTSAMFPNADLSCYEGLKWLSEEELLNTPGLQAVIVEVPNLDLLPVTLRCLERKLPVHMDKPGGDDLAAFAKLRQGYEDNNLPFQIGYMFRNNPAMSWIREHKDCLGEIFEVQANMSHNYGGEKYQEYIGKFPGGIMFNLGCHLIDFVLALMGRPSGITPFLKSAPGDPAWIKNNCLTILEYANATVTLRACSREINALSRRRLKICGRNATLELCPLERFDGQPLQMDLHLLQGNEKYEAGPHTLDFGVTRDRYEEQLLELARMIRGEIANPYTFEHDCLTQEVLLAAAGYTSWK